MIYFKIATCMKNVDRISFLVKTNLWTNFHQNIRGHITIVAWLGVELPLCIVPKLLEFSTPKSWSLFVAMENQSIVCPGYTFHLFTLSVFIHLFRERVFVFVCHFNQNKQLHHLIALCLSFYSMWPDNFEIFLIKNRRSKNVTQFQIWYKYGSISQLCSISA